MWKCVYGEERDMLLNKAVIFTGNHKLYGKWMLKVVKDWIYTCMENLSNISINRQAFIGHCACCYAIGCPEDITRLAWHQLTQRQQDLANKQADNAIAFWENKYRKGIQLCLNMVWG